MGNQYFFFVFLSKNIYLSLTTMISLSFFINVILIYNENILQYNYCKLNNSILSLFSHTGTKNRIK